MSPTIRPETSADARAIRRLTDAAFADAPHASGNEGTIVDALRAEGTLALSLVAGEDDAIVGRVAFSAVTAAGEDVGWYGLGPISVSPDRQRQGIGTALIRAGLDRLRARGGRGCVLVGDPGYYCRFGFEPYPVLTFAGVPAEYFLRRTLAGNAPAGAVTYRPAFYAR